MTEDFRRDATENLTFGEMKDRDEDNLRLVMKACKEVAFDKLVHATLWSNIAMTGILNKFGIHKDRICGECLSLPTESLKIQRFIKEYLADPTTPKNKDGGLPLPPQALYTAKELYKAQLAKDVQIEKRDNTYTSPEHQWKSGVYVYHHNEIAYFMSAPYKLKGGLYRDSHIIIPRIGDKWYILTNWDDGAVEIAK